jgi:hypothetical protein
MILNRTYITANSYDMILCTVPKEKNTTKNEQSHFIIFIYTVIPEYRYIS